MTTSREPLNLQEEWVLRVEGLAYPAIDMPLTNRAEETVADVAAYSAVSLFLQRARQSKMDFTLTAADIPHVVRLCRLLEGLPLALELAATWVRDLSCGEVVAEIERGVDFLATRLRNLPARHRSLRAVFEHSWQILSAAEQNALQKLSVFRGGFDREAAAQVAGATLPMLARLTDKSLLRRAEDPVGRGRYDMHEMIRQFAGEQLADQPEEAAACRLVHGRYYAQWTQSHDADHFGATQVLMLRFMRLEADNLRIAWQHLVAVQATAELDAFVQGLAMFFSEESRHSEAITLLQQALDWLNDLATLTTAQERLLARLLWTQGALCIQIGDFLRAERLEQDCLALAQQLDESHLVAKAYYRLTQVYVARNEFTRALACAQEGLALFRKLGDERGETNIYTMLGRIYSRTGDYPTSTQHFQAALAYLRRAQDFSSIILVLTAIGANAIKAGEYTQAQTHLQEAYRLRKQVGGLVSLPEILLHLGIVAEAAGEYTQAEA
ncbi:MAG: tetratricopeptide repeat protein, partial [Caldilineaceae bacterium]|nr:tetratricopeptide repeat protein [Caldilineaceae bacterium]